MYTQKREFTITTTRVFQNGNSQALRIPQEMKTDKKDYCINKNREYFCRFPADDPWTAARQVIGTFLSDFMDDRKHPLWKDIAKREEL